MRILKSTESLECFLTDTEKLEYGKRLSLHLSEKSRIEGELKSVTQQFKGEIESHTAQINVIAQKVGSGKEYRPVVCNIEYDFTRKEKTWIRTDTFDVVKTDILTEKELQEEIDFNAAGGTLG